jgi:hypothetical protein
MTSLDPSVIDWLLEDANPSVRYRTLVELLGRSSSDPDVLHAKERISSSRWTKRIFKRMHPDGYWLHRGKGAGIAYAMSKSTHFVLALLAELGMDRSDERVSRAVERYLSLAAPDVPDPAPWEIPPDYRNRQSCLYAYNLRTFVMLGYRDDPRVRERINVLLADVRFDDGYLCIRKSFDERTKSCIRGTIKALTAFAELSELWATPRCQQVVDYFLRRRVLFKMTQPDQFVRQELTLTRFPFGIGGTLLEPLYALCKMGYGHHPALGPSWELLATKKDEKGRYILDRAAPMLLNPGPKATANKWATLYAYLATKHALVAQ